MSSTLVRGAVHESHDANTVRLRWQRREGNADATSRIRSELQDFVRKEVSIQLSGAVSGRKEPMDILDIYPDLEQPTTLNAAVALLDEGAWYLSRAQDFLQEGDDIAADDEIQKFHGVLPELFCCRDLGDGLGAIVNAANIAINNQEGAFLNNSQVDLTCPQETQPRKTGVLP